MGLTKANIAEKITDHIQWQQAKSVNIIENLLEIIKSTLGGGDDVLISGFGKFQVKEKSTRKGRNPATGEDLMLPARKVVTFKCSGKLRELINRS